MSSSPEFLQTTTVVNRYSLTSAHGRIEWQIGTGRNVELTYLRVTEPRKGHGTDLLRAMIGALAYTVVPYETVYGFTRCENVAAQEFYQSQGFQLTDVNGVYRDGIATVFSARYNDLCTRFGILPQETPA